MGKKASLGQKRNYSSKGFIEGACVEKKYSKHAPNRSIYILINKFFHFYPIIAPKICPTTGTVQINSHGLNITNRVFYPL